MHRIRFAMAPPNPKGKLQGTIEVDETYCGGRPRYRGNKRLRGRGTKKTPVMAVLQRGGDVRARVVPNVSLKTLRKVIFENATRRQSRLMTDQLPIYKSIGREFEQGHLTVNHFWNEYARGDATVNTAESFFAILKRGLYGTFHAVSKKHLHRYINEFEFKWNNRKLNDSERVVAAIKSADGKRLMYREPTIV
jgi:transposase-like protein